MEKQYEITPTPPVLLPAQVVGWKRQLRIDSEKSFYLRPSTAEAWQKLAAQCANQREPLQAFEDEVRRRHVDVVIQKSETHWYILPLGDWGGMPRIYLDLPKTPLYERR